jgi:hypothetical protein
MKLLRSILWRLVQALCIVVGLAGGAVVGMLYTLLGF